MWSLTELPNGTNVSSSGHIVDLAPNISLKLLSARIQIKKRLNACENLDARATLLQQCAEFHAATKAQPESAKRWDQVDAVPLAPAASSAASVPVPPALPAPEPLDTLISRALDATASCTFEHSDEYAYDGRRIP